MGDKISNLSVFIIAKDEERHIRECIASADFAAEIIVVDSGSSDRTVEIAKKSGAHVIENEFRDFSAQKNFALQQTRHEWVFSLDADERITSELQQEIKQVIEKKAADAFFIRRVSYLFNRRFRYSGTQHDYPMRLFKRSAGIFKQAIHEVVEIQGSTQKIHQPILHYTFQRVKDYLRRLNLYTTFEASQSKLSATYCGAKILLKSIGRFVDIFFFKRGMLDGTEGFIYAWLSAWYEWVKQFKIWEAQQSNGDK